MSKHHSITHQKKRVILSCTQVFLFFEKVITTQRSVIKSILGTTPPEKCALFMLELKIELPL